MKKVTLLSRLLAEGWFEGEKEARIWAMERKILVDNEPVISVSEKVKPDAEIRVKEYYKKKYVSKGGLKLEGALKDFQLDVRGITALDCGASTGGFTDCLVVHGAARVYAVDVGFGQIAGKLQSCPQVVNMERTNLSDPILKSLDPKPSLITLDLSYLSLKKALPLCREILAPQGRVAALIKPLFEVESAEIRRSGVIDDPAVFEEILLDLCRHFDHEGLSILGLTYSPIRGNTDTVEYFIELSFDPPAGQETLNQSYAECIGQIVEASMKIEKFKK